MCFTESHNGQDWKAHEDHESPTQICICFCRKKSRVTSLHIQHVTEYTAVSLMHHIHLSSTRQSMWWTEVLLPSPGFIYFFFVQGMTMFSIRETSLWIYQCAALAHFRLCTLFFECLSVVFRVPQELSTSSVHSSISENMGQVLIKSSHASDEYLIVSH